MKRNAVSSQADSLIEVDRMLLQEKSRADGFAFVYPPVNVHRDLESLDFLRTWWHDGGFSWIFPYCSHDFAASPWDLCQGADNPKMLGLEFAFCRLSIDT